MDFDDDEAPPALVDTSTEAGEASAGDVTTSPETKVPITIVTGTYLRATLKMHVSDKFRIFGGWKDDFDELHPYRATWKEDCGDFKWYCPVDECRCTCY